MKPASELKVLNWSKIKSRLRHRATLKSGEVFFHFNTTTSALPVFGQAVAARWPIPLCIEFVRVFFRPADWQSIHLYKMEA